MVKSFRVLMFVVLAAFTVFAQKSAPDISVKDINGHDTQLSQQRGKVVLITIWSVTCHICHGEIPKLNKFKTTFTGKDVEIWGMTYDRAVAVKTYLAKNPFEFTIFADASDAVFNFGTPNASGEINIPTPTYVLIDQKGNIDLQTSGFGKTEALEKRISELLLSAPPVENPKETVTVKRDIGAIARSAFAKINAERAKLKLKELVWNEELAQIAQNQADEMLLGKPKLFNPAKTAKALNLTNWKSLLAADSLLIAADIPDASAVQVWLRKPKSKTLLTGKTARQAAIGISEMPDKTLNFTLVCGTAKTK